MDDTLTTHAMEKWRIIPIGSTPAQFVRILAFDAGGAGSISSLGFLRSIMRPHVAEDTTHPRPDELYPCKHFEMICGSEWGGILAVMLGRLRMVFLLPPTLATFGIAISDLTWNPTAERR